MYDGIFIESIEINETQLSRTLNIPIDKIILILKMLEREGMIHYDKSLGMPKITYLMDRP
ncbi:MAG: hypothetical protein IPL23_08190 [Saprospiraceae bacterium]|nr:hypothetical protein [Saprospiraceae bacterium]